MDDFIWPQKPQAVPQDSPPTYTDRQNYCSPPPHEASGPPPSYKHKRTPSQEAIYMKELKAWAAEKEKMYPGAYGEYGNISLANPSLSNNRVPRMPDNRQFLSREQEHARHQDHESNADVYEHVDRPASSHAADSTPGMPIPGTRRKDSVGEYESAKRPGTGSDSAPRESGIKRRMSNFIQKMGMSKSETKGRDNDVLSEGLDNTHTGALEKEPTEEVEEQDWIDR